MQPSEQFRRGFTYLYKGPSDLPEPLQLEWRFIAVRWIGIAFVSVGCLVAPFSRQTISAIYLVLLVAALYNLSIQRLITRRPELFINGYVTTFGDGLLNVVMVTVGGGFDSPLYYLLFTVTISAAMRYGYGPSSTLMLPPVIVPSGKLGKSAS